MDIACAVAVVVGAAVTRLVNGLETVERDADSRAGHDLLTTANPSRPLGRTLASIDEGRAPVRRRRYDQ